MDGSPPASSAELSKWLRVSREAQASIGRSLRAMDQAHAHIERLVEKDPRAAAEEKDAPASS